MHGEDFREIEELRGVKEGGPEEDEEEDGEYCGFLTCYVGGPEILGLQGGF